MEIINWSLDVLKGSLFSVAWVALIVIPIMVVIELAKHLKVIDKLAPYIMPGLNRLGLPKEAAYPLLAGVLFGISYGAGVIIQSAREGVLSKYHLDVVNIFLVICHAMIEDTMLFVAVGAKAWVIIGVRIGLAIIITYGYHHFINNQTIERAN